MRSRSNKLFFLLTGAFLFWAGNLSVLAEQVRAVVLEREGDSVVINRGAEDGVKVGQLWTLDQSGNRTGTLVIESLREHSASGRLQGNASVGTLATLDREGVALQERSISQQAQQQMTSSQKVSDQNLRDLRRQYKKLLSRRTESRGFKTRSQGAGGSMDYVQTGFQAYQIANMVDMTNQMTRASQIGGFASPGYSFQNNYFIASMATDLVGGIVQRNQMAKASQVRVDVEVTYWDEELVDLQTEVAAAEEGLSIQQTLQKKVQMANQRGSDKYAVFEFHLKNVGALPAPLEPFQNRVFMMSAEDKPIVASRAEPVLNRTLQPGDEIRGFMYFPKIVAAGQEKLTLNFQQMFGDQGTVTFRVR